MMMITITLNSKDGDGKHIFNDDDDGSDIDNDADDIDKKQSNNDMKILTFM